MSRRPGLYKFFFIAGDRFDASTEPSRPRPARPQPRRLCLPDPNWLDYYGGTFAPLPSLRRLYLQAPCSANMEQMARLLEGAPKLEVLALL
jgi:hypothetical protein